MWREKQHNHNYYWQKMKEQDNKKLREIFPHAEIEDWAKMFKFLTEIKTTKISWLNFFMQATPRTHGALACITNIITRDLNICTKS